MALTDQQIERLLLQAMRDTWSINYGTPGAQDRAVASQERILSRVERDGTPDQYNRFIGAASNFSPAPPQLAIGEDPFGGRNRPPKPTAEDAAALWSANRLRAARVRDEQQARANSRAGVGFVNPALGNTRGASAPSASGTGNS